jgi:hypothetical protein
MVRVLGHPLRGIFPVCQRYRPLSGRHSPRQTEKRGKGVAGGYNELPVAVPVYPFLVGIAGVSHGNGIRLTILPLFYHTTGAIPGQARYLEAWLLSGRLRLHGHMLNSHISATTYPELSILHAYIVH